MPKGKNIALFFGSFNPIHHGHLMIAQHLYQHHPIDEIWFVLSPQNPLKDPKQLINFYDRLEMLKLAIEDNLHFKACDIEQSMPKPSYTIDTLALLEEKYPEIRFSLIMGADNINGLHKWKNYEHILANYSIYIYPRIGNPLKESAQQAPFILTDTPCFEISSSYVRNAFKMGKSPQYFIPKAVLAFIEAKNLYR